MNSLATKFTDVKLICSKLSYQVHNCIRVHNYDVCNWKDAVFHIQLMTESWQCILRNVARIYQECLAIFMK